MEEAGDSWSTDRSYDGVQLMEEKDDSFAPLECERLSSLPGRDKAAAVRRGLVPRHKPTRQFLKSFLPVLSEGSGRVIDDDSGGSESAMQQHLHARGEDSKMEWHLKDGDRGQSEATPAARAVHSGKIPNSLGLVAAAGAAAAAAARTPSSPWGRQDPPSTEAETGFGDGKPGVPTGASMRHIEEKQQDDVSLRSAPPVKATVSGLKLPPIVPSKPTVSAKPQLAQVAAGAVQAARAAADASTLAGSTHSLHFEKSPVPPAKPARPSSMAAASLAAQQLSPESPKVPPRSKRQLAAPAAGEPAGGRSNDYRERDDQKLASSAADVSTAADAVIHADMLRTRPSGHRTVAAADSLSFDRASEQHADGDRSKVMRHEQQRQKQHVEEDADDDEKRQQQQQHRLPHVAHCGADSSRSSSLAAAESATVPAVVKPESAACAARSSSDVSASSADQQSAVPAGVPQEKEHSSSTTIDGEDLASTIDASGQQQPRKPSRKRRREWPEQHGTGNHVGAQHDDDNAVADRLGGAADLAGQPTRPTDELQPSHGQSDVTVAAAAWTPLHARPAPAGAPELAVVRDGVFTPETSTDCSHAATAASVRHSVVARPDVQPSPRPAPVAAAELSGGGGLAHLQQQQSEPATQNSMLAFARSALRSSNRPHPAPPAAQTVGSDSAGRNSANVKATPAATATTKAASVASGSTASFGILLRTTKPEAEARLAAAEGSGDSSSSSAAATHTLHRGAAAGDGSAPCEAASQLADAADQRVKPSAAATGHAESAADAVPCHGTGMVSGGSGSDCGDLTARVPAKPRLCPPQKPMLKPQLQLPAGSRSSTRALDNDVLEATSRLPPASTQRGSKVSAAAVPAPAAADAAYAAAGRLGYPVGGGSATACQPEANGGTQPHVVQPAAVQRPLVVARAVPPAASTTPVPVSGAGGRLESSAEPQPRAAGESSLRAGIDKSAGAARSAGDSGSGPAILPVGLPKQQEQQQQPTPRVKLRRKSPPPPPPPASESLRLASGPDDGAVGSTPSPAKSSNSVQRRHTHGAYDVAAKGVGTPTEPPWVRMAADREKRGSLIGGEPEVVPRSTPAAPVGSGGVRAVVSGAGGSAAARPVPRGRVAALERLSPTLPPTAGGSHNSSTAAGPTVTSSRAGPSIAPDLAVGSKSIPAVIAQRRSSKELTVAPAGQRNDENKPPPLRAVLGSPLHGSSGSLTKDFDGHLVISTASPAGMSKPLVERLETTAAAVVAPPSAEERADVKSRQGWPVRSHQDQGHRSVIAGTLQATPSGSEGPSVSRSQQIAVNGASNRSGSAASKVDAGAAVQEPEFMKRFRERKERLKAESSVSVDDDDD